MSHSLCPEVLPCTAAQRQRESFPAFLALSHPNWEVHMEVSSKSSFLLAGSPARHHSLMHTVSAQLCSLVLQCCTPKYPTTTGPNTILLCVLAVPLAAHPRAS